jgi:predicted NUDIX family NTP pyrophosphohydrolase
MPDKPEENKIQRKRISAGLLMYRINRYGLDRHGLNRHALQVLLAHPGGPFFRNKDDGVWSIPKGEPDDGEAELLITAKREFEEETGFKPEGSFIPLGSILQKGGKTVYGWAFEGTLPDGFVHKCNSFETEWPSNSGKKMRFLEIDKIDFFDSEKAKIKIKQTQVPLIERLEEYLKNNNL